MCSERCAHGCDEYGDGSCYLISQMENQAEELFNYDPNSGHRPTTPEVFLAYLARVEAAADLCRERRQALQLIQDLRIRVDETFYSPPQE
jgi:hypothetical protein